MAQPFNADITALIRGTAGAPQPWLARLKHWESAGGRAAGGLPADCA